MKKKANPKKGIKVSAKRRISASFNPKIFLAQVSKGKAVSKYTKNEPIFSQGQIADAVYYIQKGKVKLTVVSKQGKEAVVAILEAGAFLAKAV